MLYLLSISKNWVSWLFISLSFLFIFQYAGCVKQEEHITIALFVPLTGPASMRLTVADAMQLGIEEINEAGGVYGKKFKLLIIRLEGRGEKQIAKEFNRIEKEFTPLVYVGTTTGITDVLATQVEESGAVLVGLGRTSPDMTTGREWVFSYNSSADGEVGAILPVIQKLMVEELGIFYQNDGLGEAIASSLKKRFEESGGSAEAISFHRNEIIQLKEVSRFKGTDAVYVTGAPHAINRIISLLNSVNYMGSIIADSGTASLSLSLLALQDVYLAAPIIYRRNHTFSKGVRQKYEARLKIPFTHQAAYGYDFIMLLAGLLERGQVSRESLKTELAQRFSYPGVFGYIEKDEGEHSLHFPLYPARIVDKEVHYLK